MLRDGSILRLFKVGMKCYDDDDISFITEVAGTMVVRQYNDELKFLERLSPSSWRIKKGFQPNMNVRM